MSKLVLLPKRHVRLELTLYTFNFSQFYHYYCPFKKAASLHLIRFLCGNPPKVLLKLAKWFSRKKSKKFNVVDVFLLFRWFHCERLLSLFKQNSILALHLSLFQFGTMVLEKIKLKTWIVYRQADRQTDGQNTAITWSENKIELTGELNIYAECLNS